MTLSNRAHLRRVTDEAHERAEMGWTQEGRFTARHHYDDWLAALLKAHLSLGLPASITLGGDMAEEAQRIAALSTDLGRPATLPAHPLMLDRDRAWGIGYALNGAALGASLLLKGGGTAPGWPTAYLLRMQAFARSGELKRFFAALDDAALDRPAAVAGAHAVFAQLTQNNTTLLV